MKRIKNKIIIDEISIFNSQSSISNA